VLLSSNAFAAVKLLESNDKTMLLNVTEQYTLGDNDTLTSAEGVAIEQVKRSATNYAGSYVESVLVVQDSNITTEQVKILSAGFMEVLDSNFKRTINKSGSVVLSTDATVRISMESIRDGLAKLKNDSGRKKQIDALQQKNDRLQKQLIELTRKINSSTVTRADLMKSREEVLSSLNNNRESAKKVFEKGTLFQLAMLDDSEYELAKRDIDENLFGYFINETKISLGKPTFEKNSKGNYNIIMDVSWNLPKSPAKAVLNKYLRLMKDGEFNPYNKIPYGLVFDKNKNTKENGKHKYTEKIRDYLRDKRIVIEVDAQYAKNVQLLSNELGYVAKDYFGFQFSDDSKGRISVDYGRRFKKMVIYNIKPSDIENITAITAKVKVMSRREYDDFSQEVYDIKKSL
jgi:hypothetical protein